jgi:hypothetical protein
MATPPPASQLTTLLSLTWNPSNYTTNVTVSYLVVVAAAFVALAIVW